MTRKIIFIVIGAVLFLALVGLLWLWLFNRAPEAAPANTGTLGSAQDKNAGGGAGGGGGSNTPSTIGSGAGSIGGSGKTSFASYTVARGQGGTYTAAPLSGAGSLTTGIYFLSNNAGDTGGSTGATQGGGGTLPGTYLVTATQGGYTIQPVSGSGGLALLPAGTYTFVPQNLDSPPTATQDPVTNPTTPIGVTNPTEPVNPLTTPSNPTTPGTAGTAGTVGSVGSAPSPYESAWLGGGVGERTLTQAEINQLNSAGGVGGTPLISLTPQPPGVGTAGLILGAVAAGCAAQYAANQLLGAATGTFDPVKGTAALVGGAVLVYDFNAAGQRSAAQNQTFMQCLVKSIAQAALDQITRSVVSWINSGFNGKPSFVTNFNQYFASVADQAAGEFIKGSALSFLCSPFAPQIKIAIAQSYANRGAQSCTLTKVIGNVNRFLAGGWSGWGGLLQFTTVPTNNPYGAYAYAQVSLNAALSNAQNNANRNVSPGGFISIQKCSTPAGPTTPGAAAPKQVCSVSTPGTVIEESLKKSLIDTPLNGLNLAQDINQIISALTNQVMIKALYGGLGGALGNVTNPLAPAIDQAASTQAQALLGTLETALGYAGQYGSVMQGSIADINQVAQNLNTVFNCWTLAATSTALTTAQRAQAQQNADDTDAIITTLTGRIDAYNREITRANAVIAAIQTLQTEVLFAATPGEVQAAAAHIAQAQAGGVVFNQGGDAFSTQSTPPAAAADVGSGPTGSTGPAGGTVNQTVQFNAPIYQTQQTAFITQADVVTAQQNRATLQAELAAINSQGADSMRQCRAFGQ